MSPNWSLTWKNTLSTNLSFSFSKQTKIEKNQEIWDQTWSGNLELRYDIKGSKGHIDTRTRQQAVVRK